jgi:hypothetical protein
MSTALNDCSSLSSILFNLGQSTSSFDLDAFLPVLRSHPTLHSLHLFGFNARLGATRVVRLVLNAARDNRNNVVLVVGDMPSNDSLDVILSSLRDFRSVRLEGTFMSGLTNENVFQLGQALRAAPNVESLIVWCSAQNSDAIVSALCDNSFVSPFCRLELAVEVDTTTKLNHLLTYIPKATNLYSLGIYGRGVFERRSLEPLLQAFKKNGSIHYIYGTTSDGVRLGESGTDHNKRASAYGRRNRLFKDFVQTQSVMHVHPSTRQVWPSLLAAHLQAPRTAPNNLYKALLAMD